MGDFHAREQALRATLLPARIVQQAAGTVSLVLASIAMDRTLTAVAGPAKATSDMILLLVAVRVHLREPAHRADRHRPDRDAAWTARLAQDGTIDRSAKLGARRR